MNGALASHFLGGRAIETGLRCAAVPGPVRPARALPSAPPRGWRHCRAQRVGADRSATESGDEDSVEAVEEGVLGEAVEAVLDAQRERRVHALDRREVR